MTTVFGFAFKTGHTTGIVTGFTTKGYRVSAKQQLPGFALKWGLTTGNRNGHIAVKKSSAYTKWGHTTGIVTGFTTKGYRVSAKQQLPGFALKWGFGSARRVIGRITTERVGAQVRRWSGYRAAGRKHFF